MCVCMFVCVVFEIFTILYIILYNTIIFIICTKEGCSMEGKNRETEREKWEDIIYF